MRHLVGAVFFVTIVLSQFVSASSFAQTSGTPLAPGYYIVVAAYKLNQDSYAQTYIDRINKNGLHADYGKDEPRKYIYVYLDYFSDYDTSIREMLKTRKEGGFANAWVRIIKGDPLVKSSPDRSESSQSVQQEQSKKIESKEQPSIIESPVEPTEVINEEEENGAIQVKETEEKTEEPAVQEVLEENPVTEPVELSEASVYLSLYNPTNNEQIEGEVEVIDADRARLIAKVKGNENIKLPDPKNKTGTITLLANVFGYRPVQHEINFLTKPADTLSHFIEWAGNHYLIKFDLVRYHKGDIQTLYNVYFYNDAAIMLPESKYQLNQLLEMMQENPDYRIRLHGHTNGNARGRLITMGPSKQFFALADDVKDGSGSAKELSKQRAEVIKEWLMSEGIAADRMEIKAWGGGRMIHDKNSVNAKKNVRVDVEIIEE